MAPTVVLISGCNRGIGRGLLELCLAKPNHILIAAVRDPQQETSQEMLKLPTADGTTLVVVKIDCTVPSDPAAAFAQLAARAPEIDHLDVVVANAGIARLYVTVAEVTAEQIQEHINANVYGLIWLYQAALPLLKKSQHPVWVTMGSSAAFLTNFLPMKNAAYAPTKVVGHWLTKAMHTEEPWLTAFPIDPGWVQTDLGNHGAAAFGYAQAAIPVEESVKGVLKVVDAATRETHGGKLWSYTGDAVPW
ncbi:Glucose/ribitol dehydrogenase [Apiospora kogelbergensis]|uniref:Glucose/ribitol dehydrogenase n=1 Tax=Apiospora kogelbergensis TaxID=1337665 RepID=A0AAW0R7K7_9PEZI